MGKVKKMEPLRLQGIKGFFVFLILGALLSSCAGNQYLTPRQKEGDRLLLEKKPDQAMAVGQQEGIIVHARPYNHGYQL